MQRVRRLLVGLAAGAILLARAAVPAAAVADAGEAAEAPSPAAVELGQAFGALDQRSAAFLAQQFARRAVQAGIDRAVARGNDVRDQLLEAGRDEDAAQAIAEVRQYRSTLTALDQAAQEQIRQLRQQQAGAEAYGAVVGSVILTIADAEAQLWARLDAIAGGEEPG
ncbi:MAG: hypothetical protein FWJ62_10160, partial [Thermaerobacter sp.]